MTPPAHSPYGPIFCLCCSRGTKTFSDVRVGRGAEGRMQAGLYEDRLLPSHDQTTQKMLRSGRADGLNHFLPRPVLERAIEGLRCLKRASSSLLCLFLKRPSHPSSLFAPEEGSDRNKSGTTTESNCFFSLSGDACRGILTLKTHW